MARYSELLERLNGMIGEEGRWRCANRLAEDMGLTPSEKTKFYKTLGGYSVPRADAFLEWLEFVGARIEFPGDRPPGPGDAGRALCFDRPGYRPPGLRSEDYVVVPLVGAERAFASGGFGPDPDQEWVLVSRREHSLRSRANLVALRVGRGDRSMLPLLSPGDVVVVDRDDRRPAEPGRLMLVRLPDGAACIRRVAAAPVPGDLQLTLYADNTRDCPPAVLSLARDCRGDLTAVLGGAVVTSWTDLTRK